MFCWLFLLTGAATLLVLAVGLTGGEATLSLYGLQTTQPLSAIGLLIVSLFILKGVAAFGLWMEKDWALLVARVDALLGMAACIFV